MIKCRECAKLNPENHRFCLHCGAELVRARRSTSESDFLTGLTGKPEEAERMKQELSAKRRQAEAILAEAARGIGRHAARPATIDSIDRILAESDEGGERPAGPSPQRPSQPQPPAPKPAAPPPPAPTQPPAEEKPPMSPEQKTCEKCGNILKPTALFCPKCGTKFGSRPSVEKKAAGRTQFMHVQAPTAEAPAKPFLELTVIKPGGGEGETFKARRDGSSLGRSGADLELLDGHASPVHCTFHQGPGGVVVRDHESLNGVYLRLKPNAPVKLASNDWIRLGQEVLVWQDRAGLPRAVPEAATRDTAYMGAPDAGIRGRLLFIDATGSAPRAMAIGDAEVKLGREAGDIVFPGDGFVSARHARVFWKDNAAWIEDTGSSNGTYIRIRQETPLKSGDMLLVGTTLLRAEVR